MDEIKIKELLETAEAALRELREELGVAEQEVVIEGDAEQLLFDIDCLDEGLKVEYADWIYYINQIDDVSCGEIWKVKKNGEENQMMLDNEALDDLMAFGGEYTRIRPFRIDSTDGKWIYYAAKTHHSCGSDGEKNRKVTICGKMDQWC